MLSLARVAFAVEPADRLTPLESRSLARLADNGAAQEMLAEGGPQVLALSGLDDLARGEAPFRLQLAGERWAPLRADAVAGLAADVAWEDGLVHVRHPTFQVVIDPDERRGRLWRGTGEAYPLEIALRVAVSSCLPFDGGLPLHAAGLVAEAGGLVFFGPSGAGKSTLSGLSPWPVLSDELVAVVPSETAATGFALVKTGFWGTLGESNAPSGEFPLVGLVELAKGPTLAIDRLSRTDALRRLIPSVLVPSGPPIWEAALAVLGRLAARVPAYRMAWSPSEPPWDGLRELQSIDRPRSEAR